jgi:deoxyribose-phosphate aldolase
MLDPIDLSRRAGSLKRAQMARLIDHTLLRADATQRDITQLCDEALEHGFCMVTVNPVWVTYCAKRLKGSTTGVCSVAGFPLGAATAGMKMQEAREAVEHGATEIDMVINIGALKSGFPDFVEREIAAVVRAVAGVPVKAILENGVLSREERAEACELSVRAGAAFVKTATGFGPRGATLEDVALMRKVVGDRAGVKAAGGVRAYADAVNMLEAGANRLGTSTGVDILMEMPG